MGQRVASSGVFQARGDVATLWHVLPARAVPAVFGLMLLAEFSLAYGAEGDVVRGLFVFFPVHDALVYHRAVLDSI